MMFAPVNELRERLHVESEFGAGYVGQQLGAGLIVSIVKLVAAAVLAEILGVGGSKERALVMVKPPGHARRAGIFEIDDGIFIAIKERLPGKDFRAWWVIPVKWNCAPG